VVRFISLTPSACSSPAMFLLTAAGLIPWLRAAAAKLPALAASTNETIARTRWDNSIRLSPIHNLKLIIYQP
jgi:hypothetical protein